MRHFLRLFQNLLTRREYAVLVGLVVLMVIAAGLEIAGIGLVMPVVALVADPDLIAQNHYLRLLHMLFGAPAPHHFIFIACFAVSGVFVVKAAFLYLLTRLQTGFIARLNARWSTQLFAHYLHMPYGRFLRCDSATFLHNLHSARNTCNGMLLSLLMLATEGVVILAILLMLLWLSPRATICLAGIVAISSFVLYALFRRANLRTGIRQRELQVKLMDVARQGIDGIKECQANNAVGYFCRSYADLREGEAKADTSLYVLAQLPRFCIEAGAVTLGMTVLVVMVYAGLPMGSVILTVSLFAMGIVRLMPSLSRMQYYLAMMRQSLPAFRALRADLIPSALLCSGAPAGPAPALTFQEGIEIRNLTFRHEGAAEPVIHNLSLRLPRLASLAITGPTGCGKSTLADLLLGLLQPQEGAILADGVDIRANPAGWRDRIGYVPQSIYLLDASVRENVAFAVSPDRIDDGLVRDCLARAQVLDFVEALPDGVNSLCGERGARLSGGQRQRIGIARALYRRPELLVLDEATSALDTETERALSAALDELQGTLTIVMIAHRLSTIEKCQLRLNLVPPYQLQFRAP